MMGAIRAFTEAAGNSGLSEGVNQAFMPPASYEDTSPFHDEFAAQAHNRQDALQVARDTLHERVVDDMRQALMCTGCVTLVGGTAEADSFLKRYPHVSISSHAVLMSFTVAPPIGDPTFTNAIFLAKPADGSERTSAETVICKDHEDVHALQWNRVATLHQTPLNLATNKCLGLKNAVAAGVNTEKEAYGVQGFRAWKRAQHDPAYRKASEKYVISADKFQEFMDLYRRLEPVEQLKAAINKAGEYAMNTIKQQPKGYKGPPVTMEQHYAARVIRDYKNPGNFLNAGKQYGLTPNVVYTRLGADARQIGSMTGYQCLDHDGFDSADTIFTRLPAAMQEEIAAFNTERNIDESALPTADEAMAAEGLTPQQSLKNSKRHIRISETDQAVLWHCDYIFAPESGTPTVN